MLRKTDFGGEGLDLVKPVITEGNIEQVSAVLADPTNAWRGETRARKMAHLRQRGKSIPKSVSMKDLDERFERLVGEDDILPVSWLRTGTRVADAVALVRQPLPATGFLISDWLFMTNWHVLNSEDVAAESELFFKYEEDENGAISPVKAACDPDRCYVSSPVDGLDYAVVALRPLADGTAPGQRFGRVPMIGSVGKAVLGQPLNIIQHPDGKSRRVAFRNNKLLSLDDERLLVYETDTLPGSSGSPVFNDRWQLVALHHASEGARDEHGVEIDVNGQPVTDDTPEYLRQWVANSGIRVSCLVKDMRERELAPSVRDLVNAALL